MDKAMQREGQQVSWIGVNRIETGVIIEDLGRGNYMVRTPVGKNVIVNEKSFTDDTGI